MTFLDELYAIGTLTDDHDTEYDGGHGEEKDNEATLLD